MFVYVTNLHFTSHDLHTHARFLCLNVCQKQLPIYPSAQVGCRNMQAFMCACLYMCGFVWVFLMTKRRDTYIWAGTLITEILLLLGGWGYQCCSPRAEAYCVSQCYSCRVLWYEYIFKVLSFLQSRITKLFLLTHVKSFGFLWSGTSETQSFDESSLSGADYLSQVGIKK